MFYTWSPLCLSNFVPWLFKDKGQLKAIPLLVFLPPMHDRQVDAKSPGTKESVTGHDP